MTAEEICLYISVILLIVIVVVETVLLIIGKDILSSKRHKKNYTFTCGDKEVTLQLSKQEFTAIQMLISLYAFKYGENILFLKEIQK